jgi:hypothetical protein
MRTALSLLLATALAIPLLGAAPATRPAVTLVLRVVGYNGTAVVTTSELAVAPDQPFSSVVRVGDTTLMLNGTVALLDHGHYRLQVHYHESTLDRATGGLSRRGVSTNLEPDLGQEVDLAGDPAGRTTLTLSAAAPVEPVH